MDSTSDPSGSLFSRSPSHPDFQNNGLANALFDTLTIVIAPVVVILKQRQRLVCCERYFQNVTSFIDNKPVKS